MKTAIARDENMDYRRVSAPFSPSEDYPEYPFKGSLSGSNLIYRRVRELFVALGFDTENYGTKAWNPLGELISPGDRVLVKPNWVCHFYRKKMDMSAMVVSGVVIRAVLDYVYIALKGSGSVTIGDAPIDVACFEDILDTVSMAGMIGFYGEQGLKINAVDFRNEMAIKENGMIIRRERLKGDPLGYTVVDLGAGSELEEIKDRCLEFRGLEYDPKLISAHHDGKKNEYLIPNSVLSADVIINLPKLKTHRKAGMTGALKNMVGIMAAKEWLPHHRKGPKDRGCDEYLRRDWRKERMGDLTDIIDGSGNMALRRFAQVMRKLLKMSGRIIPFNCPYFEGSWWGNETISRTVVDLNKIIFYASKDGKMKEDRQRRMFILVDGVVAGEGEGPLEPTPKKCGLLLAGTDPVSMDLACSRIMGFDFRRIHTLAQALKARTYKLADFSADEVVLQDSSGTYSFRDIRGAYNYSFKPSAGWRGHIELEE